MGLWYIQNDEDDDEDNFLQFCVSILISNRMMSFDIQFLGFWVFEY